MHNFRRLATFLKIEPGEERLIGLLTLLYFILSLGFVFVQSMAFSIFLAEYGVGGLPYSYITIAVFASLVAVFYIRLGGRISFSQLLFMNLIFVGSVSLLIWLGLNSPLYHLIAFILPLWFQIAINLGNLVVWPLAGSLFDFRQAKRLFPLLASGTWLANVIGGLFIPIAVNSIGAVHLLLLGGLTFVGALFLLRTITRSYLRTPVEKPRTQRAARRVKTSTGFFKDRYVLLIFAYTVLWWVAFFFVDNIYYDRAFAQYPDANQLAAFIGLLSSLMGIVGLISATVLSSRVIARFGLRAGLLAMPLAVILSLGILALTGSLGASLLFVFALSAFAKLINVVFGFSLSQSANAIVYQSLPDTIRGRVQATAEGIVQPIAIGIAGLSLLALTAGLNLDYIGLAYVFLGLGVTWVLVIFFLSGNYVRALTRVITKRRLGDDANVLADPASLALLKERLHDGHAGIVIHALHKLEALDEQAIINELPDLLRHSAPEVRREAFIRIEKLKLRSALNEVQNQFSAETVPSVKESALRAMGAIGSTVILRESEGSLSQKFETLRSRREAPLPHTAPAPLRGSDMLQLTNALNETDVHCLRGALIGLLKYGDGSVAEQTLNDLLASPSNADRNLAIEVLGEINRREWYPHLLRACDSAGTSRAASLALTSIGAQILPEIETAFCDPEAPPQRLSTLANALGRIGGTDSQTILVSRISTLEHELRSQILNALSQSSYRTKDIAMIQRAVQAEAEQAAWASATQVDLREMNETPLLREALTHFHAQIRNRVLSLLSFVFDSDSIRRVREAFVLGSAMQISYALEIMDVQLSAEWKKIVMPLLEDLAPHERMQRLATLLPQRSQAPGERLQEIVKNETLPYWVRACAAHAMGAVQKGEDAMLSTVERVLILKTVSMFSQTPDNVLADVADLLEEVDVAENETIFKQGDPGDSLYVILDGKVSVHDSNRLLNYLGERDVFGEMALLDPEPRLASVTAVEPTRLFRLDQAPFYELMAERPEVATGIIRVLTGHLRNRVRDIAQLNERIRELESLRAA